MYLSQEISKYNHRDRCKTEDSTSRSFIFSDNLISKDQRIKKSIEENSILNPN